MLSKNHFVDYSYAKYIADIDKYGIEALWNEILNSVFSLNEKHGILSIANFGELYEIGLAYINKIDKKEHGKYYTPEDVATLMSEWLLKMNAENVCDVCCGTGNLILAFLNVIGKSKARNLIKNNRLYLYDQDALALKICKYSIGAIYGEDIVDHINCVVGDFLDKNISLPPNCKVISNPPYYKIKEISKSWENTDVVKTSRELYSAFMEKIIVNSQRAVIITPYSFISGEKFFPLRQLLNNYNGFIVSFDNIPGSIFNGRKHGIFNSNTSNAVRAAITVVENKSGGKGFRLSPLIRFKSQEREKLLNKTTLEGFINPTKQKVTAKNKRYYKCFPELTSVFSAWCKRSDATLADLISEEKNEYFLCVPNSCRYYVSCAKKDLQRTGKHIFYAINQEAYEFLYCFINSSFAYWFWRLYDGGINYPAGLLKEIPIMFNSLTKNQKVRLHTICTEMQAHESEFLVYKRNASEYQENVKFPIEYREQINGLICEVLGIDYNASLFKAIYSNRALREENGHE